MGYTPSNKCASEHRGDILRNLAISDCDREAPLATGKAIVQSRRAKGAEAEERECCTLNGEIYGMLGWARHESGVHLHECVEGLQDEF